MSDAVSEMIRLLVYDEIHTLILGKGGWKLTIALVFGEEDYWREARSEFYQLWPDLYDNDGAESELWGTLGGRVVFWNMSNLSDLFRRKGLDANIPASLPTYEMDYIYLIGLNSEQSEVIDSHKDMAYYSKMAKWKTVEL